MIYNEVQIRSKSAIIYPAYAHTANITSFQSALTIQDKINNNAIKERKAIDVKPYSGKITKGAKKRLTRALSLFVQSSKQRWIYNTVTQRKQLFQLAFITLTVSDSNRMLTAKEAHSLLLEPFLLYLRRKHQVINYVWKAELQKRGQIHYHITIDQFIEYTAIKDTWNNLQRKAGLLDGYFKKYGTYSPNSTDIHSVKKIKNFEAYMVKYMCKENKDEASTDGKVWDCSVTLKRSKYYTTALTYGMERTIKYVEAAKLGTVQWFERFTLITFFDHNAAYILEKDSLTEYNSVMAKIRSGVVDQPPEVVIAEVVMDGKPVYTQQSIF